MLLLDRLLHHSSTVNIKGESYHRSPTELVKTSIMWTTARMPHSKEEFKLIFDKLEQGQYYRMLMSELKTNRKDMKLEDYHE